MLEYNIIFALYLDMIHIFVSRETFFKFYIAINIMFHVKHLNTKSCIYDA